MSNVSWEAFDEVVRTKNHFALTTHVNPDGDGLGSEVALALYLVSLGKSVRILNDGRYPPNFEYLHRHYPIETFTPEFAEQVFASAEVLVVLDMQNPDRLGRLLPYLGRSGLVVVIDHHVGKPPFGDVQIVHPEAAATGELIYDFIRRDPQRLTRPIAEALYTSLVTDTGSFRHSNTDADAHSMAAHLMSLGIEAAVIQAMIHQHRHADRLRFLGHLLQELRMSEDGKIAWFEVLRELFPRYQVSGSDLEGLVDFPRTVPGVEVVMLLTEQSNGTVKVSLRSAGFVDVNRVVGLFGGGGHRFAAGATVTGTMAEAREKLLTEIRRAIAETERTTPPVAGPRPSGSEVPAKAAGS